METTYPTAPAVVNHRDDWMLVAKHKGQSAMVLGIASIVLSFIPLVIAAIVARPETTDAATTVGGLAMIGFMLATLALGIIALVLGVKARRIFKTPGGTAGFVTGIIGTVCGAGWLLLLLFAVLDGLSNSGY